MQEFAGKWVVEPDPAVRDGRSLGATKLRYEISVVPKWPIPNTVVSHLVKAGLPANITAIAERAEEVRQLSMFLFKICVYSPAKVLHLMHIWRLVHHPHSFALLCAALMMHACGCMSQWPVQVTLSIPQISPDALEARHCSVRQFWV